ncbi:efflux transporter outer membrane subunit [Rhodopila sp.]|uniref:efflux transporter outer membrane subunit n=1 Tax=Rhodopila sp. TaxID=2480087 RepID=UPI003D109871
MPLRLRLLLLAPLLAGCTLGPNFQASKPASPDSWFSPRQNPAPAPAHASFPVATPIQPKWWDTFNDPVLSGLVLRVANSNLDVRAATTRIAQSRSQLRITGASEYPTLNGNTAYTRERVSQNGVLSALGSPGGTPATQFNGATGTNGGIPVSTGRGPVAIPPFDLYQYGFDASWEVDLWGRVRRTVENARATLDASREARNDTVLSSMAEVANDYMQLRGTQERLRIARQNLASANNSVQLTTDRYNRGLSTELDLANAQQQASDTGAIIPQLEQQEQRLINAIGLLLGEYPGALQAQLALPKATPLVPPLVPVGLPSELAHRRPDIREAEAQLHAATASIGAAEADFFPQVTLSGSVSIQALQFHQLGDWGSRQYGIGPSVSLPIFEGGRLRGTLALRQGQQQEAAANYQRTVLAAFRDVDDALTAYAAEQRRRARLIISVAAARRALDLATMLYTQGLADFLQVLTAQRSLLSEQQQLADSTATVCTDLVALYKALGGGWDAAGPLPPPAPAGGGAS